MPKTPKSRSPFEAATTIPYTSFSRLMDFEECEYRSKLAQIDRVPQPPKIIPPGKAEHPGDRGNRIHDEAEAFVKGEGDFTDGLRHFEAEFNALKRHYESGKVVTEEMWCFDREWNVVDPRDFKNIFLRVKSDCVFKDNPYERTYIDYKTGKRRYNEIKHGRQTQLYAVAGFIREPNVEMAYTELWYLDLPDEELYPASIKRTTAMTLAVGWMSRFINMCSTRVFTPKPGQWSCRFCPYAQPMEDGSPPPCEYRYQPKT